MWNKDQDVHINLPFLIFSVHLNSIICGQKYVLPSSYKKLASFLTDHFWKIKFPHKKVVRFHWEQAVS